MSLAEQLQPDDEPAIQEFLNDFERRRVSPSWRLGRVGPANEQEAPYISGNALHTMLDLSRVQKLLNALYRGLDKPAPDAGYIRKHCLRTFAILLTIGYGRVVYVFAKHPNLHDQHLPHLAEPQNFPFYTQINLFARFYEKQWAFCVQTMKYDMGYRLSQDVILPIIAMDMIHEEGGSATMFKIQVDEDCNELQPEDDADRHTHHRHRHTFALKTYRTTDARKYYETESDAFKHLRYSNRPPPNIIAFYGGFERDNVYNIILEYADGGSLEEYMERTPNPANADHLKVFWNQLFNILNGLATIHGEEPVGKNGFDMLLGWHQDINPANILIKTKSNASCPYDVQFKIADLGLSHFKRHNGPGRAIDRDTFGTRAYGAPETHRTDFNVENSTLQVRQDVDIWSTGCVISEVVTWVSQGWDKVLEYRHRRSEEVHRLSGRREDCFHNDAEEVLQTVHEVHNEVAVRCPPHDELTEPIIDHLIIEMLLKTDEHRPNAKYLYKKSKRMVKQVPGVSENVTPIPSPSLPPQSLPPKRPPPGYGRKSSRSKKYLEPHLAAQMTNSLTSLDLTDASSRDRSGSFQTSRSVQNNSHRRDYSDPDYQSPSSPDGDNYFGQQPVWNFHNNYRQIQASQRVDNRGSYSNDRRPSMNDPGTLSPTSETAASLAQRPEGWTPPPELSVEDGLEMLKNNIPSPDEHRMEELQGRDHVFVIDNSTSSNPFRLQMAKVLEVLARKLENASSGLLYLYFMAPYKKLKRLNASAILNEFNSMDVRDMPDMRSGLARILDEYQDRLGKIRPVGYIKHPKTTPLMGCNKLSLYVLTDGIWQPNVDLLQEVQTLVDHLMDRKLTNKQVGIQFIRFGQNPQAIEKLRKLDVGEGFQLNIVDTTPANGNVWKMLLGSINSWFGAADDFDDTESAYEREPSIRHIGSA